MSRAADLRAFAGALAVGAMLGVGACNSSALSLGDPNDLNAELFPPFIYEEDPNAVWTLTLLDESDSQSGAAAASDMSDNYIISADFGQGVGLNGTGYTFKSNFVIQLGLTVYAGAEPGTRTFNVRFVNDYGEFLAHGEFEVFKTTSRDAAVTTDAAP